MRHLRWVDPGVIVACTEEMSSTSTGGGAGSGWGAWLGFGGASGGDGGASGEPSHAIRVYAPTAPLDDASMLLHQDLTRGTTPVAMASSRCHVLLASYPSASLQGGTLEVAVYALGVDGDVAAGAAAGASAFLTPARRVSLTPSPGLGDILAGAFAIEMLPAIPSIASAAAADERPERVAPTRALARASAGGALHVFDLGASDADFARHVASRPACDGVDALFVSTGADDVAETPRCSADVRWSWWTYGVDGWRAWYERAGGDDAATPTPSHGGGRGGDRGGDGSSLRASLTGAMPNAANAAARRAPAVDDAAFRDPELEFDAEAYPIGMTSSDRGARITAAARTLVSTPCSVSRCHEIALRHQNALPCALRHLLRAGEMDAAAAVAAAAAAETERETPTTTTTTDRVEVDDGGESDAHARALEWLVHAALDRHAGPSSSNHAPGSDAARAAERALADALSLARRDERRFPAVVVAVARKSDPSEWPALFARAGDVVALLDASTRAGKLRTSAAYLVVVDALKGHDVSASAAAGLLRAALSRRRYSLAGELTRFTARRPAVAEATANADSFAGIGGGDDIAAAVSGMFKWLGLGGATPPAPSSTTTPTTPLGAKSVAGAQGGVIPVLPHDARVALRDHARSLATEIDLGSLAVFARETGFDVGAFFENEKTAEPGGGAARLRDFPAALARAAFSLRRRQDDDVWTACGPILRQMVAVGAVEWALVTATLLRRTDTLARVVDGRRELLSAWREGVEKCAQRAASVGDDAQAQFLRSLLNDMLRGLSANGSGEA